MEGAHLPFGARFWLAITCFFRVLSDGGFAARVAGVGDPSTPPAALPEPKAAAAAPAPRSEAAPGDATGALQLLSLLQREGRFVDFVQQELGDHPDADIGAAARVVHEGCRKALKGHVTMSPVREEEEGSRVELEAGFDPATVKLSGKVEGAGPHAGVLRHRGWRVDDVKLPKPVKGHDARVIFPAEVEL